MKLKRLPEDFRVVELTNVEPTGGAFALYRLTKTGLGTPEAIAAVVRHWRLTRERVSFGGLKDRHAVTEQFVSIHNGPRRGFEQDHLKLEYLGQIDRAFRPADITGNRFDVTLRDLAPADRPRFEKNLEHVARDGVPNYFDDQRFGSLGESGEFVARAWCAGDWERTLWLAVADPNVHDTPRVRRRKQLLTEHWGDFKRIAGELGQPQTAADASVVGAVQHLLGRPADFRGAIARIDVEQRGLYLASFQSHLWNRILAALLRQTCRGEALTSMAIGPDELPFYRELEEEQRRTLASTELPLPSARQHLAPGAIADLVTRSLAESGIELRELRVKYPRDSFFSKGQRRALCRPEDLRADWKEDELHAAKEKLALRFRLPRGSYATIVVKRLSEL